jgi:uncharacterized membrane protein YciS (DUF1049 family)
LGVSRSSRISFNFLLQYGGYKVFGAVLSEFTAGLLALSRIKMIWILAIISIFISAAR